VAGIKFGFVFAYLFPLVPFFPLSFSLLFFSPLALASARVVHPCKVGTGWMPGLSLEKKKNEKYKKRMNKE